MEQRFSNESIDLVTLREFCEREGEAVIYRRGDQMTEQWEQSGARSDFAESTEEGDSQLEREGKAELYESSSWNHFIRLRYSLGEQPRVRVT